MAESPDAARQGRGEEMMSSCHPSLSLKSDETLTSEDRETLRTLEDEKKVARAGLR